MAEILLKIMAFYKGNFEYYSICMLYSWKMFSVINVYLKILIIDD